MGRETKDGGRGYSMVGCSIFRIDKHILIFYIKLDQYSIEKKVDNHEAICKNGGDQVKIDSVKIKNFRGYKDETTIELNDLTVFVGKNDIGKSTILEALDIFFNDGKGVIKLDKTDVNVKGKREENLDIEISVCFSELPEKIIIDSTVETSLQDEFMLNANGQLEVIKRYKNGGVAKIFIKAKHPTNSKCSELLVKKNSD